jgi:RNA polymerase sigma-70 factor (ECF subfamily)
LRAWRRLESYEGRGSFRAWLYKIATNVCLDALDRRPRRVLPPSLRPASRPGEPLLPPISEPIWLEPFPDELLAPSETTPEVRYDAHESITLAFLTALQVLSPRQRAVLILCDVLDWSAKEAAGILEMSLPAANSLLHRARGTLSKHYTSHWRWERGGMLDPQERALLGRYVSAWEALDIDALVSLIKEDASLTMPPLPLWYQGRAAIRAFFADNLFTPEVKGRLYMRPLSANGQPAFAWYLRDEKSGVYHAYVLQLLDLEDGLIAGMTSFGFPELFPRFGLTAEIALYER